MPIEQTPEAASGMTPRELEERALGLRRTAARLAEVMRGLQAAVVDLEGHARHLDEMAVTLREQRAAGQVAAAQADLAPL